jgi:hypothetical protein
VAYFLDASETQFLIKPKVVTSGVSVSLELETLSQERLLPEKVPTNELFSFDKYRFVAIATTQGSRVSAYIDADEGDDFEVEIVESFDQTVLGEHMWLSQNDDSRPKVLAVSSRASEDESVFSVDLYALVEDLYALVEDGEQV